MAVPLASARMRTQMVATGRIVSFARRVSIVNCLLGLVFLHFGAFDDLECSALVANRCTEGLKTSLACVSSEQ